MREIKMGMMAGSKALIAQGIVTVQRP